MSTPSSSVTEALARWRGNLIDLTRRNPLLALRADFVHDADLIPPLWRRDLEAAHSGGKKLLLLAAARRRAADEDNADARAGGHRPGTHSDQTRRDRLRRPGTAGAAAFVDQYLPPCRRRIPRTRPAHPSRRFRRAPVARSGQHRVAPLAAGPGAGGTGASDFARAVPVATAGRRSDRQPGPGRPIAAGFRLRPAARRRRPGTRRRSRPTGSKSKPPSPACRAGASSRPSSCRFFRSSRA